MGYIIGIIKSLSLSRSFAPLSLSLSRALPQSLPRVPGPCHGPCHGCPGLEPGKKSVASVASEAIQGPGKKSVASVASEATLFETGSWSIIHASSEAFWGFLSRNAGRLSEVPRCLGVSMLPSPGCCKTARSCLRPVVRDRCSVRLHGCVHLLPADSSCAHLSACGRTGHMLACPVGRDGARPPCTARRTRRHILPDVCGQIALQPAAARAISHGSAHQLGVELARLATGRPRLGPTRTWPGQARAHPGPAPAHGVGLQGTDSRDLPPPPALVRHCFRPRGPRDTHVVAHVTPTCVPPPCRCQTLIKSHHHGFLKQITLYNTKILFKKPIFDEKPIFRDFNFRPPLSVDFSCGEIGIPRAELQSEAISRYLQGQIGL